MSTDYVPEAAASELEERPRGSLLRADVRRLTHRRFIRWLLLVGIVGYLGILVISWTQFSKRRPSWWRRRRPRSSRTSPTATRFHDECLAQLPAGEDPENCGTVPTAEDFGDLNDYLPKQAFNVQTDLPALTMGFGGMVAAFCFLMGATWIGAEWSQKSLMALLFWEPRRLKVLATKIGVLVGLTAAVAALAQAATLGAGFLLGSAKGDTTLKPDFWSDLIGIEARCVLLAVLVGLIGFGIANLIRNTGAALGVGFVYFIAELILVNARAVVAAVAAPAEHRCPHQPGRAAGLRPHQRADDPVRRVLQRHPGDPAEQLARGTRDRRPRAGPARGRRLALQAPRPDLALTPPR